MDEAGTGRIVRPFGLLGSRYFVNKRGLLFYKAAYAVAFTYVISLIVTQPHVLLSWASIAPFLLSIVVISVLVGLTVRNGRKIG